MKKLFILSLAISLFTCKEEPKIDYVVLSGKIENPKTNSVSITNGTQKIVEIPAVIIY